MFGLVQMLFITMCIDVSLLKVTSHSLALVAVIRHSPRGPLGLLLEIWRVLATRLGTGGRPSQKRDCRNHDHRPLAKAIEELSPILSISFARGPCCIGFGFIDFHGDTFLVKVHPVMADQFKNLHSKYSVSRGVGMSLRGVKSRVPREGNPPQDKKFVSSAFQRSRNGRLSPSATE
jgi:hypothetical protein